MKSFKDLDLSEEILKVLEEMGFETPSEIQELSIPHLLETYDDYIGLAQTGTGKTAAFGIPLLERIDASFEATQALVLAPTRELGQQIAQQLESFGKYLDKINVLAVYGGTPIQNQIKQLKKTQHVIIATPGRLIDLIKRKAVHLDQLHVIVLDEADEMLNMGFKDDIDQILSYTPEEKMTWLFSATMPNTIKSIVNEYMVNPIEVKVDAGVKVNENIEHQFLVVKRSHKVEALKRILDINENMRGVVFCRTRRDTQELAEELLSKNYKTDALHGDLSQAHRDRVMRRFKEHELQVLIATDVAARGIDVNDLTHVIHFSLPDDGAYYTHRSGRTARAGKKGISIAFIGGRDFYRIKKLQKELDIYFTKIEIPSTEEIASIRIQNWCYGLVDSDEKVDNPKLLRLAQTLFGELSKEDLIERILSRQIESLQLDESGNLNETIDSRGGRRSERRSRGGSGRRRSDSYRRKDTERGTRKKSRRRKDSAESRDSGSKRRGKKNDRNKSGSEGKSSRRKKK